MPEREFDSITGVPVYSIRNCEYPVSCSYPYCSCRVPHDQHDQPLKAKGGIDYSVVLVWLFIIAVLVAFWVMIAIELKMFA